MGFLLTLLTSLPTSSRAAELEAAVAVVEITPPVGYRLAGNFTERISTGTHDPLLAKALVFRQGEQRTALVFCDLLGVPRDVAVRARERARAMTGIPFANIAVAATHSHNGPLYFGGMHTHLHGKAVAAEGRDPREPIDYPVFLSDRIAEAVGKAAQALAPVALRAGIVRTEGVTFNRRFHMKDGSVRFNPGVLNPDIVRPAGPVDPDLGIILVEPARDDAGRLLAGLTVFALHLATRGGNHYSADYPFDLETALKQAFGPGFVSLFGAGTCGDLNHIDVRQRGHRSTEAIGKLLADTVVEARPQLERIKTPALAMLGTMVTCDLQMPSAVEIADARARANLLATNDLPFLEQVRVAKVLDQLERYPGPRAVMEVQALRVGPELAIVTLPGEVFVELGLAIKSRSPFQTTLVVELANDTPHYIPTSKAFQEGSYEVVNSRLAPGSGEQLVAAAVRLLRELDRVPH
jgi:hypothetical protein